MKDGTLVPWRPNPEPDPLLVQMNRMKISVASFKELTYDEMIAKMVEDYLLWEKTNNRVEKTG
jgi:hypothetical protein